MRARGARELLSAQPQTSFVHWAAEEAILGEIFTDAELAELADSLPEYFFLWQFCSSICN